MSGTTEQPLAGFERLLLEALTEVDAQRPFAAAPAPTLVSSGVHWWRPALVTASVAALAVGAIVVGAGRTTPGGGAPPAVDGPTAVAIGFTLVANSDGSISFTATDLVDPVAATKALNDAGIAGRVVNNTNGCPDLVDGDLAPGFLQGLHPRPRSSSTQQPDPFLHGARTVTIRSSDYPANGGVLVVVIVRMNRPVKPWAAVQYYAYTSSSRIPTCADITDPGTD
jgi:hypothetical protein